MQKELEGQELQRKLSTRMITMMTIGGSVSTGIFLASGNAIHIAGPVCTLLAYFVMGIMVYFLMTSLGEMAALLPSTGSFYVYAAKFVDPALGYALAWLYWYSWSITIASEMSAASLIMHFWFPNSSSLLWCASFLSVVVGFNIFSTKVFGEAEYWFSLIKVLVIIIFIIAGFGIIFGITKYEPVGFKYWAMQGAVFHGGYVAVLSALIIAGFSFQGTEMLAVTAGECQNPGKTIPKAVKQIFWRIILFFILSILVISLLIPYTSTELASSDVTMSPFTLVFKQYDVTFAAGFINGVILIAVLSAGNSGMYAASRIFWYLAKKDHAPKIFSKVNKRGVPIYALAATTAVAMLAFLSSLFGNGTVYFWLISAVSLSGFIIWLGIAISHYRFRKAYILQGKDLKTLPYLSKGHPYSTIATFILCLLIIIGQNYQAFLTDKIDWIGVIVSYSCLPLFLLLWCGYKWVNKTKIVKLADCNFELTD